MDVEPRSFFKVLSEKTENEASGPKECQRLLSSLNSTISEEQQNSSLLDSYILHMFDKSHGLLNFVTLTVNKKIYKNSIVKILEILHTFVNSFHNKLKKHVVTINEICLVILKSGISSADEKCKAFDLLSLGFDKIDECLEHENHYSEIYKWLRYSLQFKNCDSVKSKRLIALGTFAKNFRYLLSDPEDLQRQFVSQLELEMTQKNISSVAISGIYTGLTGYCESFSLDPEEDEAIIKKLYGYIERVAIPQGRIRVGNRAALTFLTRNITVFSHFILSDYKKWHGLLNEWLTFVGNEDRKVGAIAIEAYYRGLARILITNDDSEEISMYFLNYFKTIIANGFASSYEKRSALKGLCAFSGVYYNHLKPKEVTDLFIMILQIFERTYVLKDAADDDQTLEYLPDYVQTVAHLMRFKKITASESFCLQRGVINMMKIFPKIPYSYHGFVIDALVTAIHCLRMNDEILCNHFIDNTIYQGVVWACSHQHISEAELAENKDKIITVNNYLPLWKGLIKIKPVVKYDQLDIYLADREYILLKVVDRLVKALLMLINKLNVSIIPTETHLTDIEAAYKVAELNDFAIFLNVVDFYQAILTEIEPTILRKCILKLVDHLIMKCVKFPFISGFYKLLSLSLMICNKLSYFYDQVEKQDAVICFESLSKFVEILLVKVTQFKDDLLMSCLRVLLEYPITIIQTVLHSSTSIFVTIFNLGRSYIPLVQSALDTLERWQSLIPNEDFEPFLIEVLPVLDSYLQSKSLNSSNATQTETRRKTAKALKKRRVLVEIEPELLQVQRRILDFVGRQNSSLCLAFVSDAKNIQLAVWGNKERLKIALPFEDVKLDVYLDKFLPRIVHLALHCSDRRTRITACELLQAVVMVFLGTTKQMNRSGQQDLDEVFRHLAMPLLKLGCDLDQLVQDIFQPLFLQLIHWYTHSSQMGTEHSVIVIEAVLDGLTHPTDTSLRDFSGKCINEFVKWTIKQSDDTRLERNPLHFKMLLNKMRFFSTHPDPNKKLAAALIFNNIYKEIREQQILLNMFWFEYLHIFVKSLSLIGNNFEEENAVFQIYQALDHIQRGLVEKSSLFNKKDKARRVPNDFNGEGTLKDVSLWILSQTGSESCYCREKCITLFINITLKVGNVKNLKDFVRDNVGDSNWIMKTYQFFIDQHPSLSTLPNSDSSVLLKWLRWLLCHLDGLNFVIGNKLFEEKQISDAISTEGIQYFIQFVAFATIEEALNLINVQNWSFTSFQKLEFTKLKSKIIIKILKLLNQEFADSFEVYHTKEMWDLLLNSIFNPERIGFEDDMVLNSEILKFLKKVPDNKLLEITHLINSYIEETPFTVSDLKSNVKRKERNIVNGLLLLQSWHLPKLNVQKFADNLVSDLVRSITVNAENQIIFADDLQDTTLRHCLSILDFALSYNREFEVFVQCLYENYEVQCLDNNKPINFGLYILNTFEISVVPKILEHFESFLSNIRTSDQDMPRTIEILINLLNVMLKEKKYRQFYEYTAKNLMHHWNTFQDHFKQEVYVEVGIDFIKLILPLIKLYKLTTNEIKLWMVELLSPWLSSENNFSEEDLDMKLDVFYILTEIMEDAVNDSENEDLASGLNYLELKYFTESSTLPKERQMVYIEKFLTLIPKLNSSSLLIFLLRIYILNHKLDKNEIASSNITNFLNLFMTKAPDRLQGEILRKTFQLCFSSDFSAAQKYNSTTTIMPLFQWCKLEVFERFYIETVKDLISILNKPTIEENLCEKIMSLMLFEILFLRLNISSKDDTVSPISLALFASTDNNNPQNKNLLQVLLKFLLNAPKEQINIGGSDNANELLRLYKCHSYNAMVSIVCNSLKDQNFYLKLFERLENGQDILWRGLIDSSKVYKFTKVFDSLPQRRKVLVNIRSALKDQRKIYNRSTQSVKYLESQRVYNSSLCDDFTKYDFTETIVRSQLDEDMSLNSNHQENGLLSEIELDSIDVNGHECMGTICELIEHMVQTGISTLPEENEDDYVLPSWVKVIRDLLLCSTTPTNVKIFWVKVVDNTIHIFRHFAKYLLEPLLKFVLDKCAGDHINYFVADVVSVLASWSKLVTPSNENESKLISQLLHFLIVNINNERQDIFKYHLELIKLIVEAWKSSIIVSSDEILTKFDGDIASKKISVGVHLSSIFLANNMAPWGDNANLPKFCFKLFKIVGKDEHKAIFQPAAETIGLVLNFTKKEANFAKILNNVHTMLKKVINWDTHLNKYGNVLEAIALHYPEIADEFHLHKILSKMQSVLPDLQVIFMRVILKRSEIVGSLNDFKMENWCSYLERSKLEIQIISLEIVHKNLDALKDSEHFLDIIKSVCNHSANANIMCRSLMCDIAISICLKDQASEEFLLCRDVLLQSLIDGDKEIREKALDFWERKSSLPTSSVLRFSYMLNNLYKASTENEFLGYFTYLMLSSIKNFDGYKDKIFEYPLEDCDFEELHLQANWRRRHLSVLPMFAETLRSLDENLDLSESNYDRLRQTQTNLTFAPTQSQRNEKLSQFTASQSTLFIKSDQVFGGNDDDFVNPNSVLISQKYRLPKRRFLRDRSKISKEMAQYEVKKSVQSVEKRRDLAKARENEVSIFRNYRKGDLPDVQIPLSDLIAPLQALSLHDSDISKTLFLTLFHSVAGKTGRDDDFITTIYEGIKNIFDNSTQYNTNLFRALFDIILKCNKKMFFDPNEVTNVCLSSGLLTVGVLLLEEYLISHDSRPSSSKRNRGAPEDGEATFWVKLAELYKEIDEWDMVKSIFLEKLDCKESVQQALLAESRRQWRTAQDHYINLLQEDDALIKKDFYYESYFKCLAHMGQWEKVASTIEKVVPCETDQSDYLSKFLWDDDWNRQKLLPWYINAKLKHALFTRVSPDDFFINLNDILKSPDYADHLQNRFSEELSMFWMFQNDIENAKHQLRVYLDNFLENWQLLDPVYTNLRYSKLLQLRNIVDINQFINVFDNVNAEYDFNKILTYWRNTSKETLPSILYSETRALYRRQFVGLLVKKLKHLDQDHFGSVLTDLARLKFDIESDLVDTAIDENNFYMGRKYIKKYESKNILKVKLSLSKLVYVTSCTEISDPELKIDRILKSLEILNPCLNQNNDLNLNLAAHLQLFNDFKDISRILNDHPDLYDVNIPKIEQLMGGFKIKLNNDLSLFGADKVKVFIEKHEKDLTETMACNSINSQHTKVEEQLANAYTQLAYFSKTQDRSYFKNFILFVLRAMKLNSQNARQLFPCILMEHLDHEEKNIFLQESKEVPIWMFCAWIPQLLVHIDSPNISIVSPIILKMAKTYPQAIMYAYRLSKENFSFQNVDSINEEANNLILELDSLLLSDERIDKFLKALRSVCIPSIALAYYIAKVVKACVSRNNKLLEEAKAQVVIEIFEDLPDSKDVIGMKGNMYKKITTKYKSKLNSIFKEHKLDILFNKLKQIYGELDIAKKEQDDSKLLKDYCPWLANFSVDKLNLDLEIPGQYDGKRMPLIQYHAKISGFHPNVCIMKSLRKPIKLTILGNDTKEYPFLLKFGEDIRQDQRIQQLFTLMNGLLCNQKELIPIETYQVVPLTSSLGIIQWVKETTSMQDFVEKSLTDETKYNSIGDSYNNFIFGRSAKSTVDGYGNFALKMSKDKVIAKYRSFVNEIPWDIMRQSFWKLSANTESFFSLRSNFIKSYAVMCAAHWLLGIGDRHLCNSLICSKTGKVLGIDFGHAFGTATQILPVPELVPFRLTPHLIGLMEPTGERGLFREVMLHTLKNLREEKGSLLATMNVFIQEPSIDWLEHAVKCEDGKSDRGKDEKEWYPKQKVRQAERKLNGANPTTIMIEELTLGQKKNPKYMEAYVNLVRGEPEFDLRARMDAENLSPEDQVDCLIDHASSYNLLGRMYAGWSPWV